MNRPPPYDNPEFLGRDLLIARVTIAFTRVRIEKCCVDPCSMNRCLVSNWSIAQFRKADFNAKRFEGLTDSDRKIGVPRDPVD